MRDLLSDWTRLLSAVVPSGADPAAIAEAGGDLLRRWSQPHRRYHDVEHLACGPPPGTKGHDVGGDDVNGALLCDADLAVLARSPDGYDRYAAAIREEYSHVPEDSFRAGRGAVLRHLLDLPALYRLPRLRGRWEEPARANLRRELDGLS